MYFSGRDPNNIVHDPQRTKANGIVDFINQTCVFCYGSTMPTEEIYDRYVRFCNDTFTFPSTFNVFARSFKYYAFHNCMVAGIQYIPINYYRDTPYKGIIKKRGWGYVNIAVNY